LVLGAVLLMATHSTPFSRLVTGPNDDFGLKVTEYAREHDDVFKSAPEPGVVKVRGMVLSTPLNGFIGCCAALADHDFRSAVANVSRPVLFLVGEKDPPNAAMREMHKELNGSQFVEIAGAGHICNIERPEMFTNALEKFLMQPTSSGQSGSL
jgi:3-oxoadipate enol-lactonase